MGNCCSKESKLMIKIDNDMNQFYFRFMKLDYIEKRINEFIEKKEKNYFTFWQLTKLCGINSDLNFQNKYWELVYVKYGKDNITGVLFIFIILSKSENDQIISFLKYYLSKYVNKIQDNSKKLIMNLNDFEIIIKTYFSCLTTIALETTCATSTCDDLDNFKKEMTFYKKISKKFSNEYIAAYTNDVLHDYVTKNYYVKVEDFLENNLDLLKSDKRIRSEIYRFSLIEFGKRTKILDYEILDDKNDDNQPLKPIK